MLNATTHLLALRLAVIALSLIESPAFASTAEEEVDRVEDRRYAAMMQGDMTELVVNLKTAKALGLIIPQSILLRADEVIQ